MKFLKHTVWSLIVASMMTACMGFDEINVDPDKTNRPTPGMLATQILFSMMDSRSNSSEGFANHCMLSKHIACGEKIRDYAYNRIGRTGFGAYTSLIGSSGRRERQLYTPLRYAERCDRGSA